MTNICWIPCYWGGHGGIPATFNLPKYHSGIYQAVMENDLDKATFFQQQLAKLSPLYTLEQPFLGVIKTAIKLSGSTYLLQSYGTGSSAQ